MKKLYVFVVCLAIKKTTVKWIFNEQENKIVKGRHCS